MLQLVNRFQLKTAFCLALALASPAREASADEKPESQAKKQVAFGIEVARTGLWREAIYRWQKAIELDPQNASARNNLGVAYEQDGKFDLADQEYKRALDLDPNNAYIRQNYELFREAYERRKRKDQASNRR
jgi:Flp pilus assembly protein TadD